MPLTRRDFMTTGALGAAGLYATRGRAGQVLDAQALRPDEDGYRLWLRYAPPDEAAATRYRSTIRRIVVEGYSPTAQAIRSEVGEAVAALLGAAVPTGQTGLADRSLVIGTPASSPPWASIWVNRW